MASMHETLEDALNEKGELMIQLDSGHEAELHLHNTRFLSDGTIKVDAADEVHWFNADKIERYWIHKDF